MADITRIKGNIQKMIDMGAPESDIDAYVAQEGVTLEQLQAPAQPRAQVAGLTVPQGIDPQEFQARLQTGRERVAEVKEDRPGLATGLSQVTGEDLGAIGRRMIDVVPLVGGFADEAQAALTGEKLEDIQARDAALQEAVGDVPYGKAIQTVGDIAGGVGIAGGLGSALGLGAAGGLGARSAIGAIEGASRGEGTGGRILSGALGALLSAVAPGAAKQGLRAIRGVSKRVAPEATETLSRKVFKTTKKAGKDIAELASSDADMNKLLSGADASKDIASEISEKSTKAIRQTPQRLTGKIEKALGVDDINKFAREGQERYATYLRTNANKRMPQGEFQELLRNPKIRSTLEATQAANRELRDLPIDSLPVLQKANSEMLSQARNKLNPDAGFFSSSVDEMKDAMKRSFKGFGELQNMYRKVRQPQVIAEAVTDLQGRVGKDFAGALDTIKTQKILNEGFGEAKANKVLDILQDESEIAKNLRSLQIKGRSAQQGKGLRQALKEAVGSEANLIAGGVTAVNPALGAGILGAKVLGKGAQRGLARRGARKLLGETAERITPIGSAILGQQAGAIGSR